MDLDLHVAFLLQLVNEHGITDGEGHKDVCLTCLEIQSGGLCKKCDDFYMDCGHLGEMSICECDREQATGAVSSFVPLRAEWRLRAALHSLSSVE